MTRLIPNTISAEDSETPHRADRLHGSIDDVGSLDDFISQFRRDVDVFRTRYRRLETGLVGLAELINQSPEERYIEKAE